jgi:hypothetical protein
MNQHDSLRPVLREWQAPEPGAGCDARVRDAWRSTRPPVWRRVWTARVSVPVPVLAALVLAIAAWLIESRGTPPVSAPKARWVVTETTASGFVALPNGTARVVPAKDLEQ